MSKIVEMKKIIKPLIKECLTEILMEEGLMKIVKESVQPEVVQTRNMDSYSENESQFLKNNAKKPKISMQEAKNKLIKEIGMNGFDPFAGSVPYGSEESETIQEELVPENKVLPGIQGRGIDISGLLGSKMNFYNNALNKGKKE